MAGLRIGVICEGTTDHAVLRPVLEALTGGSVVLLQPDGHRIEPKTGPGWQGVRAFLRSTSDELAASPLDLIVVQIDADVRRDPELVPLLPLPDDGDPDLDPLCHHVKSWMTSGVPDSIIVVLPRERTEAWLLAANSNKKDVESVVDPDKELPDPGSRGKRDKSVPAYQELVKPLLPKLARPKELAAIPELERFVAKVRARLRRVRRA